METISHRELRNNSSEVLRRVEAGEWFVVTNSGRRVARLGPVTETGMEEARRAGQARPARSGVGTLRSLSRETASASTEAIISDLRGDR